MRIKDIAATIETIAPLRLAQAWDNVGLLIGSPQADIRNILLTIDVTKAVIDEAKRQKAELIISYHPVIWDGLKKITTEGQTSTILELIRAGIAVFSIHTALDSAIGGVNDGLAEIIGIENPKPIGDYVDYPAGGNFKLVVFVPAESASRLANAVFAAGAGAIGNYSHCGFQVEGTGTFLPLAGAKPAIGRKGKLETVKESRLETIVPAEKLDSVIAAMKKVHPYEMPAYDVIRLSNEQQKFGLGRIGKLSQPLSIKTIIRLVKKATSAKAVGIVGTKDRLVRTAAVCAGSCGAIINQVITAKTDLYLTGELKHHQALAAQELGLTCICLSHTVSERFMLRKLAKQLKNQLKQVNIKVSKKDADPFEWKVL